MRTILLAMALALGVPCQAPGQGVHMTKNFVVTAPTDAMARKTAEACERHRAEFAREWLGRNLPDWQYPTAVFVLWRWDPNNGPDGQVRMNGGVVEISIHHEFEAYGWVNRHEIGHVVINREVPWGATAPRWFHEGVMTADELFHNNYPVRFSDRVGHEPLSFWMSHGDIAPYFDPVEFYGQAAVLVYYLRQQWGTGAIFLFHEQGRTVGWEAASRRVFGKTLRQLEDDCEWWQLGPHSPYPNRAALPQW